MAKQVLLYSDVKPLNSNQHANLFLTDAMDYSFSAGVNAVPLTTVEFTKAAAEYVIVFAGEESALAPYAVLGMREGDNSFVDNQGKFNASYIPAFIRRYPFVFSTFDEGKNFTLCIDVKSSALNTNGSGRRLFEQDGKYSEHLSRIIAFMTEYQRQYNLTNTFCRKLKELNLLAPFSAKIDNSENKSQILTGFYAVGKDRLKCLSAEQLKQLAQSDELELIYNHIQSMVNFERYLRR